MNNIDISTPLSNNEINKIVDSIAIFLVKRRLETPAVLFIEMNTFIYSKSSDFLSYAFFWASVRTSKNG